MKTWLACLLLAACGHGAAAGPKLAVTSTAFAAGAEIPTEHTCDGADTAPPLQWSGAPATTKSYTLIVDDPDAPGKTWVHWVLVDIPGTSPQSGGTAGTNDFGKAAWGGPCPPSGRHRYYFKVYALDTTLGKAGSKADIEAAMKGHIVAQGELVGTYQKKK